MRSISLALFTLVAACGGGKAALPSRGEAAETVLGVRVAKPREHIGAELVHATGTLRAREEAVLSAPATGTLDKLFVRVGDRVKAGQALAQLDTSNIAILVQQARAARAVAQAGYDAVKIELERAKQLRATDAAPVAVLDRAIAAHNQATAGLEAATLAMTSAEENLRDHTLRAPFEGVVTQRFKNTGETVAMMPPTPIVSIVDAAHLEVRVPVPETVVDFVQLGGIAKGIANPSGKTFEAKVTSVGVVVDPMTRTVEVLCDVVSEAGREMRPGSLVVVDFSPMLGAQGLAGLYIPAQAVRTEADKSFVFIVSGGVVEQREVTVEPITPGIVRVRGGVKAEDDVVIEGTSGLKAGAHVRAAS